MEAGLITTHNAELAQKLRQMRDYGKTPDGEDIAWLGLSARVPEINAIVAYHNFIHMDELVNRRRELMGIYREKLAGLKGVTFQEIPDDRQSSGNYFTIFINQGEARHSRDEVYQHLKEQQIQAKKYFYPALHRQQVYQRVGDVLLGKITSNGKGGSAGVGITFIFAYDERSFSTSDR